MANYIVVENTTGLIVNRIILNDPGAWEIPAGHSIFQETAGPMNIGGTYIGGVYTPPAQPPPPPPLVIPNPNERLDAGIAAALAEVIAARNGIHSIPHGGAIPARFEALLTQLNVLTDAVVAMLQAQANPP